MGGREHGLNLFKDDRFVTMHFAGGATIDGVSGIVFADDGSLWLNTLPGVVRVSAEQVAAFLNDPGHAVIYELFDYLDGLPGNAEQLRPLPSAIKDSDGRLWFATTGGLVFIDPASIYKNPVVPPVALVALRADGRLIETESPAHVPKGTKTLELDYTALSLSVPERVHFKYKLEGFDRDWQDVGNRRQAFYTHLPPGNYDFRVIASNNDGVWNTEGVLLPVDLPTTFLQSWMFKMLCGFLAAALLWCFYLLRVNHAEERIRSRLYERLAERERIARDLHDTFFQSIQGLLLRFNTATGKLGRGEPVRILLEEALAQSDHVMEQGRDLLLDLRTQTSEANDLVHDLKAAAAEFTRVYPAHFTMVVTGKTQTLNSIVSEELYRIGREALYNSFRHAGAKSVEAEITYNANELRLNFRDDGAGMDLAILRKGFADKHYGLPGMKERAEKVGARFLIHSGAGSGTEIEVRVSSKVAYRSVQRKTKWRVLNFIKKSDSTA